MIEFIFSKVILINYCNLNKVTCDCGSQLRVRPTFILLNTQTHLPCFSFK